VTGPKLNEAPVARPNGQRPVLDDVAKPGTKAVARYVRTSSYKVREVLDLIRGQTVQQALDILRFTSRGSAEEVSKVLASAVANAEHNDGQVGDELYVSACFADEGPTLKRWRPRARGRATRIRKRTCHITIVVTRLPEGELTQRRAAEAANRARRRAGGGRRQQRDDAAVPSVAEEAGIVDATEAAVDAAADAGTDDVITDDAVEAETAAEEAGIVDATEAAVEAAEEADALEVEAPAVETEAVIAEPEAEPPAAEEPATTEEPAADDTKAEE
jgi:large subunit ribosomal protein L22